VSLEEVDMERTLARTWWLLALRGIVAILFGIVAFLWPGVTWLVVVASFAAFATVDGIFALVAAFSGHGQRRWWALALEGIFGISVGVITLFWPQVTQLALLYLIAYWAIVTGLFEVIAAVRLREEIEGEWLLGLAGILSMLFGVALVILPGPGALAVAWLIGCYAIAAGLVFLILAYRMRESLRLAPRQGGMAAP